MSISSYGSWPTPITSELVVAAAVRLDEVRPDGTGAVVWGEGRATEGGRIALVRRDPDGTCTDLLPDGGNARSAVHEYGGGSWWTSAAEPGVVFYVEWTDQRLRRLEGNDVTPLTPEPAVSRGDRYADGDVAPDGTWLVCVREHHPTTDGPATEVVNEIVRLDARTPSTPEVMVSGPDFVAAPRLSPDAARLAWISWDHPSMPWDDTVLTVRDLASGHETVVAGGPEESVAEPAWQPDGSLVFLSDRTGWWNLYRWPVGGVVEPLVVLDAEIGVPGWQLGGSRSAMLNDGTVVFARSSAGFDALAVRKPDRTVNLLDTGFTAIRSVRADGPDAVLCVAGSPTTEPGIHRVTTDGTVTTLRAPRDLGLDPTTLSVPEPMTFLSVDAHGAPRDAHALYYPPSGTHTGPSDELPPLLVVIHGGPTGAATPVLAVGLQYWTSRGFGVVDVNYGGSTGYGRAYREQLDGAWGIVDVADCLAAARALADAGRVDRDRMAIRGGSAGGFTTLAALAREDTPFSAGADHFGVADLEALARDTHKFESRYLDGLVGPYPADRDVYVERSPLHHVEQFATPLIVLQGDEDAIVPPNQSEMIVDALRARGVPVAYLLFAGEQHGFRQAANIRRALDAELAFYARLFGFTLPDDEGIEPVAIENLD
ncbi:prolyl oligopeptidase family serine peptidase [Actinomycetospora endophytica]|uniref:Prolyl oligopeptidase family serine peptidase n=1 Tax=Actinomycetospora endophytica TaxID=2291215 RepID=A0ABS8PEB9_9PSEU|nr:prolyl oligopeptidase family serine peptidase [Actinomycetospora endophytica]MCD2196628.1 prolyl oligopeptidase family serine peptidase [Actinomycetospora endophytica]